MPFVIFLSEGGSRRVTQAAGERMRMGQTVAMKRQKTELAALTIVLQPSPACRTLSLPLDLQGLAIKFQERVIPKHRGIL